ncbi:hypothetical protein Tco_0885412 [Tanacetum coccineum]
MFVFFVNTPLQNTMAEQNIPNQPPTRNRYNKRADLYHASVVNNRGKATFFLNAQDTKNPIFRYLVDILSNTNFFQAFTASANVPAIYLQQFWNTMKYNEKTRVYSCQIDEQWFDLSVDLLRKALAITPVIPAQPFELPPSGTTVIDFVNELGYPEPVELNDIVAVTNPDTQFCKCCGESSLKLMLIMQSCCGKSLLKGSKQFRLIKGESCKAMSEGPKKKVTPSPIPYGRFSKVIIYYLASNNNIHRRPDSAVHHTGDDFILGNLKFIPKGETVEVFGMAIPDPLITEANQQSSYYPKYLEMVAMNTNKTPQESASQQPATKRTPPKKPTTTTPENTSRLTIRLETFQA